MFDVDGNEILNLIINSTLKSDKRTAPIIKVLNKYGINGAQAMACILELAAACAQINEGEEEND